MRSDNGTDSRWEPASRTEPGCIRPAEMWGRYIRSEFSFQWNLRGARPTATAQPARMGGLYVKGARGRRAGGRLVRNSSAENGSREYPDPALNAAGTAAPIHIPRR